MEKTKKIILNILLALIFQRKVYYYPFVQSCPKLQLVIKLNGNFVLIKDADRIKIPSVEINLENKQSILLTIKDYLSKNISKKVSNSSYLDLKLIDFCREMVTTDSEKKLFVDDLYLAFDLDSILTDQDLLENTVICSLDDIKILQFKNKFNIFDYKVAIKSQTEKGILIK